MNYIILITVVISLVVILKCARIVIKASKRINLLYDYFIVRGEATSNNLQEITNNLKSSRPNPNDGSGCPKEAELIDEA